MTDNKHKELAAALLAQVPEDGGGIGNIALKRTLEDQLGRTIDDDEYDTVRDALLDAGVLAKGRGRGGSVHRLQPLPADALQLETQAIPEADKTPKPKQAGLPMPSRKPGEPTRAKRKQPGEEKVLAYRHDERRINNPEVGLVTPDDDADERETHYAWDPHIDPALQFDIGRHDIEVLIDDALASGDHATMHKALAQLKRMAAPYLNWTGKAERTSFEVDTVSLHVHERIDPATILAAMRGAPNTFLSNRVIRFKSHVE